MIYHKPSNEKEAVDILVAEKGVARVLAGGTDILVQMRSGVIKPNLIVDIKSLPGMRSIIRKSDGYEIGAAVSGFDFNNNDDLKQFAPGIAESFDLIGSTQIQGRCTIGGNLCNASPAADTVPALISANCLAKIVGPNGIRECKVAEITLGPGKTSLNKGEFIKSIIIPGRPNFSADAYLRFTPRSEMDIAVVSAAVFLTINEDHLCTDARVSLGAVAPTVIRVKKAASILIGSKLSKAVLEAMAKECSLACNPIDDKRGTIEFRSHVAGVLAKRASLIALKRAGATIG